MPRDARHARDDGDRHGEDQRTGRRHDEHGDGADGIVGPEPRRGRHRQGDAEEHQGVTVREARHRRPGVLCRLDQTHDPRISALGGRARSEEIESLSDIRRAAHHRLAPPPLHGDRLPRQRRLVEHGEPARHGAVHRHDVALAYQQEVTRHDGIEVHLLKPAVAMAHGEAGQAREERRHLSTRPTFGETLEILAASVHEGDDGGGQLLPEDERRAHREGCDDIEADIAAAQAQDDIEQQRRQHGKRRNAPNEARPLRRQDAQREAQYQSERRKQDEERPQAPAESQHNCRLFSGPQGRVVQLGCSVVQLRKV